MDYYQMHVDETGQLYLYRFLSFSIICFIIERVNNGGRKVFFFHEVRTLISRVSVVPRKSRYDFHLR